MAIISDSGYRGTVASLHVHPDGSDSIATVAKDSIRVTFKGFDGDSHSGLTRASCVRVKTQYKEGSTIRNTRQISIVSTEELVWIAEQMDIPEIKPEWLGANLCLSGIEKFTLIPPATRLLFDGGVSLVVDVENEPCKYPADIIDKHYAGKGKYFVKHAIGRRGVTAWVEREGVIEQGDSLQVHTPPQRSWL